MGGRTDKFLLKCNEHRVLYDRLQIIIQHPTSCPMKGSSLDNRKTFHPWHLAFNRLAECDVTLSPEQATLIREKGHEVANNPR